MRLYGVEVSDDDCLTLIDLLLRVGRAVDLRLAVRIESALDSESNMVALAPVEREAIFVVLDNPPQGLIELRGALARGRRDHPG